MRFSKLHFLITITLFCIYIVQAQAVTVDGNAFLENQNNHENIMIVFERTIPSSLMYTTYTNNTGYYSVDIEPGIYNISYSKMNYITIVFIDQILYSNTTLNDNTLIAGLAGQLSGTLYPGTYIVGSNIEVANDDILIIEPGVKLRFMDNVVFDIRGKLLAEGTKYDSIIFTRYSNSWGGINFIYANDNSILSYALIEYSNSSGISVDHSSPLLSNLLIRNNSSNSNVTWQDPGGGGGIDLDYSNSIISNMTIINNVDNAGGSGGGLSSCNGAPFIINSKIISNLSNYAAGGVFIKDNTTISNCLIYYNQADYGAGIYNYGSPSHLYLYNTIVCNNTANIAGGGIRRNSNATTDPTISYCDFWNNIPDNYNQCCDWCGINVTTNTNGDSCDAYNNIKMDPLFTNVGIDNFHLLSDSPGIDAGYNDYISFSTDFEGNVRIWDGNNDNDTIVDIGIYEFGAPLLTSIINNKSTYYPNIKIYPNPSNGLINIKIEKDYMSIQILNINGQLIYNKQFSKGRNKTTEKIDISNYSKGVYLVKIQDKNNTSVEKLIIQ